MAEQMLMLVGEQEDLEHAGAELEELVRQVVRDLGPKEVAWALNVSAGYLSNTLSGRDNRRIPVYWLPALDSRDPEHRIANFFARRMGCHLAEAPDVRTTEQQLRDLRSVLNRQGETGANILRAAGLRP